MANKKLADWIKTEEAQGYSEEQLVKSLLKDGHRKEEIEKAILYIKLKFHLKALLDIPYYLIGLFFVSLLLLGWAFGEFIRAVIISVILIISVLLMDFFDRKNMDLLSRIFFIVLYLLFLIVSPALFFPIALLALILTIIIFFREKRQINLYLITISLLISLFITTLISFLIYLFLVYVVINNLPLTNIAYLMLIFLPLLYLIPPLIYFLNNLALSKIKVS